MRSFNDRARAVLLAGICTILSGCAQNGVSSELAGVETGRVVVRPGDQIALVVYLEPELTDTFTVASGGEVYLPLIGPVQVAERGIQEVEMELRESYLEYLRNPSVSITVLRRIGVHGEVRSPNLYLVDATVTLRELIARAGGVTPSGHPDKIVLIRDGAEYPVFTRGASLVAAELRSGDQVVVGQRSWFERNSLALATSVPTFVLTLLTVIDRFSGR